VFELLIDCVRQQSASLVMVTHDLRLAGRADRVVYLDNGQFVPAVESINP
jgi:lipoprotein-releasing system ATP-binding protein